MTWSSDDIERYRNALLLLARALLARQRAADFDASDLVQNTLLEAHRDRERFRGHGEPERFAWLRQMLRNNLLDELAKRRAARRDVGRNAPEADLAASFAGLDELLVAGHTSPGERASRNEELARLAEAMERLPPAQREAVLLKDMAGWSLEQVGEQLGCTVAATAGLLYRGRQRLRELLDE